MDRQVDSQKRESVPKGVKSPLGPDGQVKLQDELDDGRAEQEQAENSIGYCE